MSTRADQDLSMARSDLRRRLILATMTATAATVITIVMLQEPLVDLRVSLFVEEELLDATDEAIHLLARGTDAEEAAERAAASFDCRVTIVDHRGYPVADSGFDGAAIPLAEVHLALVREARTRGHAFDRRTNPFTGVPSYFVAKQGPNDLVVQASRSMRAVESTRATIRFVLLLAGGVALFIGIVLTFALTRVLLRPIHELKNVALSLAEGDLRARTRSTRRDELGDIGRAIDHMADQLVERMETLRAEESRLWTILDAMSEAVFVTDARGIIVLTNAAFDRLIGDRAVGRTAMESLRSPELHSAVDEARRGASSRVELRGRFGVGDARDFEAFVAPMREEAGVVVILHDVSAMKNADRVRRDFVANASHELRTPLTAIRGYAETLRDGAIEKPEAARGFVEIILKHAQRLQSLVDDLVSLSGLESRGPRLALEPVAVTSIARDVVHGLTARAEEKELALAFDDESPELMAQGDAKAVDQVLVNLVDNAIKYTPSGGAVRVYVEARGDDSIVVGVHNTDTFIPTPHRSRLFERFYRVDAGRSRDVGGTGLGLSIVKHLVEQMGGRIRVDSDLREGTTFEVTLTRSG
jgi:two-component system, OmpR family, phosphate regulon sensor histidine kinase PhoR